jgi:hypothetical protein
MIVVSVAKHASHRAPPFSLVKVNTSWDERSNLRIEEVPQESKKFRKTRAEHASQIMWDSFANRRYWVDGPIETACSGVTFWKNKDHSWWNLQCFCTKFAQGADCNNMRILIFPSHRSRNLLVEVATPPNL